MSRRRVRSQSSVFPLARAISTLGHFAVLWILHAGFSVSVLSATTCGYAVGALITYLLNRRVKFAGSGRGLDVAPRFLVGVLAGLALNVTLMFWIGLVVPWLNYLLSQCIVTTITLLLKVDSQIPLRRPGKGSASVPDGSTAPRKMAKSPGKDRLLPGLRRTLTTVAWLYLGAALGLWLLLRIGGDRWWPATLLLFGPRWLFSLPLVLLIPAAAMLSRRLLWVLMAAALVVVFPIMDMRIPWARMFPPSGTQIRVVTYNVAGEAVSADALAALIEQVQPDVIALQESPEETYQEVFRDWHVCQSGELLVAAKWPAQVRLATTSMHPPHEWPRATLLECAISSPVGEITVSTVHLPSPRYGLSTLVDRRTILAIERRGLLESETQNRSDVSQGAKQSLPGPSRGLIVLGDFNMPTDSTIYRRDWASFHDAFSLTGWGTGQTVRANIGGFDFSSRIDHILTGEDWWPVRSWLGPDVGSDHLPVVADLVWRGPGNNVQ
jgi:endonuclease/exonuclease/phosphatase (EEP) superfamily protein YafD/putative flippase GtrA